ncbi:MAG: cytochrome-c peroxidase [Rubripirellula sp.]
MRFNLVPLLIFWLLSGSLFAVEPKLSLPTTPYNYARPALPLHVRRVAARFDNASKVTAVTDDGATLGRVLFYDRQLSVNGTTSCGSCHLQEFAFADGKRVSTGFDGRQVDRNSMSLVNLRYYRRGRFFWDERAESLEKQVLMPIENPIEMGHRLEDLLPRLQKSERYPPLFKSAFGDSQITKERMANALAQFVRSIVSFGSRFDVGRAQVDSVLKPFPNFTEQENYGKEQFFGRARCAECHLPDSRTGVERQSAFFQLSQPTVNGIDNSDAEVDLGVGQHSGRPVDNGKFKASTLRNIQLTSPYMHDGRFRTLDSVIEHYNWSVRPHENLDPALEGFVSGLALPEVEKVALTAFLLTLTDQGLVNDPRFADPFD